MSMEQDLEHSGAAHLQGQGMPKDSFSSKVDFFNFHTKKAQLKLLKLKFDVNPIKYEQDHVKFSTFQL